MFTDRCTDLSAHMDMITPTKAFSLLTAYQILAFEAYGCGLGVVAIMYIMCVQMHLLTHVIHDRSGLFL